MPCLDDLEPAPRSLLGLHRSIGLFAYPVLSVGFEAWPRVHDIMHAPGSSLLPAEGTAMLDDRYQTLEDMRSSDEHGM